MRSSMKRSSGDTLLKATMRRGVPFVALVVLSLPPGMAKAGQQQAELDRILTLLAQRASLQRSLLFKFTCNEDVTRQVVRRPESSSRAGFLPEQNRHLHHALILEQGKDGIPHESRVRLYLDRKGRPIEIHLAREFKPIANAVPQAQAAWFTTEWQERLRFRSLGSDEDGAKGYRIKCPGNQEALEFVDRAPTGNPPECHSLASGQICVDSLSGDITRIAFYRFLRDGQSCQYDREAPFSIIEQGVVEPQTGLRFPSRARTIFSMDWRDNAIFDQVFENYAFTHVQVRESIGKPVRGRQPDHEAP